MNRLKWRGALWVTGLGLLLGGVEAVFGQEIKVVSPSRWTNVEGDAYGNVSGYPPFRYQQVFSASDFQSVPESRQLIVSVAKRPDKSATAAYSEIWGDVQIRMSITNAEPGNMSTVFADNIGPFEQTLVYSGPITLTTANTGPVDGPKDFDLIWKLQEPFLYDPDGGNLLVDWITTSGIAASGPAVNDQITSPGAAVLVTPYNPNAVSGGVIGGFPMQFTFVPEPSTFVLATLGFLGLLAWRQKKGQLSRV